MSEPPYDSSPGEKFCGFVNKSSLEESAVFYESKTRSVNIALFYSQPYPHAFDVSFYAKREYLTSAYCQEYLLLQFALLLEIRVHTYEKKLMLLLSFSDGYY